MNAREIRCYLNNILLIHHWNVDNFFGVLYLPQRVVRIVWTAQDDFLQKCFNPDTFVLGLYRYDRQPYAL